MEGVKPKPAPDPLAEVDALCAELIAMHERRHHPGTYCLENEQGKCFDAFGGTPNPYDRWEARAK